MDILIRGMEMPKNCAECFFHKVFPATGVGINQLYCALCGINILKLSDAQPDCPLVPVPPHGRLIDADELNVYDISPVYGFSVMGVTEEDIIQASTIIEASE